MSGAGGKPGREDDPFADDQVPLAALRRQAFHLRWASQPDDVIPLTAADPDFAVAPVVREAIARQAAEGLFSSSRRRWRRPAGWCDGCRWIR